MVSCQTTSDAQTFRYLDKEPVEYLKMLFVCDHSLPACELAAIHMMVSVYLYTTCIAICQNSLS
jgi:hypothetical protein